MMENMFKGIMGKIAPGCCRLSVNGRIAIKTSNGYKTYNEKTGNLTDCSSFVLDIGDDLFFIMPTRSLKPGDVVLINGKPMYVLDNKSNNRVEVMDYESATINTVIPERHVIMGRKFYGKIVSLMGKGLGKGGGFFKNMLKLKMMSAMLGGKTDSDGGGLGSALPMMMLMGGGGMDGLFDGLCDDEEPGDELNCDLFDGFVGEEDEETEQKTKPAKPAKKTPSRNAK